MKQIVLIGYRGTGKTTVAQLLAQELGWPSLDADVVLEVRAGRTIKEIFATDGEAAFRDLETVTLRDLLAQEPLVLATGGGVILREENRKLLQPLPVVIWLTAKVETILQRMQSDPTTQARRPNLTTSGPETEIRELLQQREPLYQACSKCEIATDEKTPEEIVAEIRSQFPSLSPELSG